MQTRTLGTASPLDVSAIGFGCMGLSFSYEPATEKGAAERLLRSAVDLGVSLAAIAVEGDRYPAHLQQLINR